MRKVTCEHSGIEFEAGVSAEYQKAYNDGWLDCKRAYEIKIREMVEKFDELRGKPRRSGRGQERALL